MTFRDLLKYNLSSPSVAHLWFLSEYPKSPNDIYVFIEGKEDFSFYPVFIQRFAGNKKIRIRSCDRKSQVYETFSKVMPHVHPEGIVLFLVDKDLSDLMGEIYPVSKNIYVTDLYSIESYIASDTTLEHVFRDLFRFTDYELNLEAIRAKYLQEVEAFYRYALKITAWSLFLRRIGLNPNLRGVNFARLYRFDEDVNFVLTEEAGHSGEIILLQSLCRTQTPPDSEEAIRLIETELKTLQPKQYIQGKFELWFFVAFVQATVNVLNTLISTQLGGKRIKNVVDLHLGNAIAVLGPRIPIPSSLNTFLIENILL